MLRSQHPLQRFLLVLGHRRYSLAPAHNAGTTDDHSLCEGAGETLPTGGTARACAEGDLGRAGGLLM